MFDLSRMCIIIVELQRCRKDDELYYFETDYKTTYGNTFPIGLYLDVPDDRNVYHKWLICREEKANQFPKYLVLPCDYELCWIETNGKDRIKRRMWSVLRMQSSYISMRFILETVCRKFSNCWNTLKVFNYNVMMKYA